MRTRLTLLLPLLLLLSCGDGGDEAALDDFTRDLVEGADILTVEAELPPIPGGTIPDNARDDQVKAVERANWYRWQSGLPPLDMIDAINKACQAHCDYYVTHLDKYQSTGTSPHNENPAWSEGFTGVAPWDRMGHFGYSGGASEVIAFVHNPIGSVDGWMATLYHRIPFMDATLTACGYGAAGSGTWQNSSKIDTMDFGWNDADGSTYKGPVLEGIYPPPGSSGIPPSFDGLETPQPPARPTSRSRNTGSGRMAPRPTFPTSGSMAATMPTWPGPTPLPCMPTAPSTRGPGTGSTSRG